MSTVLQIRREWIGQALGIAEDVDPDETAISTIDVRLDQMFRELVRHVPDIALVHGQELAKIREWSQPDWQCLTAKTKMWKFDLAEGFPAAIFDELNAAPAQLLADLLRRGQPVLCSSPQFWLEHDKKQVRMQLQMLVVFLPRNLEPVE